MADELTQPVVAEGDATLAQIQEVEHGEWVTVKQIANSLGFTTAYISALCKRGQIKGVKPLRGQWRIPRSEYERITREGIPPMPREPIAAPKPIVELPSLAAPATPENPPSNDPEPPAKPQRWGPWDILFKNPK
jgi:excisionase family DNA binding protein